MAPPIASGRSSLVHFPLVSHTTLDPKLRAIDTRLEIESRYVFPPDSETLRQADSASRIPPGGAGRAHASSNTKDLGVARSLLFLLRDG